MDNLTLYALLLYHLKYASFFLNTKVFTVFSAWLRNQYMYEYVLEQFLAPHQRHSLESTAVSSKRPVTKQKQGMNWTFFLRIVTLQVLSVNRWRQKPAGHVLQMTKLSLEKCKFSYKYVKWKKLLKPEKSLHLHFYISLLLFLSFFFFERGMFFE